MKTKKLFIVLVIIASLFTSCYVGGTPCIESGCFESADKIELQLSGSPNDFDLGIEVTIDGKVDNSYRIKSTLNNPFTFKITAYLNKDVPVGAFAKVFATSSSEDLTGSVVIQR